MTRKDLINILTEKDNINLPLKTIELAVKQILDLMIKGLGHGQRIEIRGFGSFSLRHRKSRKARNPKTGDIIITNDKFAIHFKPGKELKERVNTSMLTVPLQHNT